MEAVRKKTPSWFFIILRKKLMTTIYEKMKKIEGYVFWDIWGQRLEAKIQPRKKNSFKKCFSKSCSHRYYLTESVEKTKISLKLTNLQTFEWIWKWEIFLEVACLDLHSSAPGGQIEKKILDLSIFHIDVRVLEVS